MIAFASATHDIAADGFYMLAQSSHAQAAFVGVRSAFFRVALIAGQGGLVYLAGTLAERSGNAAHGWAVAFFMLAATFAALVLWHRWALPIPDADRPAPAEHGKMSAFAATFVEFF